MTRHAVAVRTDTCAACRRGIARGDRLVLAYALAYHAECFVADAAVIGRFPLSGARRAA